ncbi:hypothetical protein N9E09_01715 [bacterium]|jgi:hypothetical protein|nr:hypothetical protein [bacterium]
MKSFKEYLTESTKECSLTLRFAAELNEDDENRIERFLGKYDLISISRTSTTPITKNPLFFSEDISNTKVSKIEIKTGYPISADILRVQLSDLLEMNMLHIAVHPEGWDPQEKEKEEDADDKKALLDSEYDDKSDNGENYGRGFIDNFLKSLSKRDEVTVENELSVKPKQDDASDQMDTDEKSSESVISGDEE